MAREKMAISEQSPELEIFRPGNSSPICDKCCPRQSGVSLWISTPTTRTMFLAKGVEKECSRRLQPLKYGSRDRFFRRDHLINSQAVPAEQGRPTASTNRPWSGSARFWSERLKQNVRDLAGHHVDLVRIGDRDQHVRIAQRQRLSGCGDAQRVP